MEKIQNQERAQELCDLFIDRHAFGGKKQVEKVNRHIAHCQHGGCASKRAARLAYEEQYGRDKCPATFFYGL